MGHATGVVWLWLFCGFCVCVVGYTTYRASAMAEANAWEYADELSRN